MEELRKCYKKLDELMKEIENRHDTDIMDFINLVALWATIRSLAPDF